MKQKVFGHPCEECGDMGAAFIPDPRPQADANRFCWMCDTCQVIIEVGKGS